MRRLVWILVAAAIAVGVHSLLTFDQAVPAFTLDPAPSTYTRPVWHRNGYTLVTTVAAPQGEIR